MRTTSVSFLLLLVGAMGACSSKSTDGGTGGSNGGIIPGGGVGGSAQAGNGSGGTGNTGTGNTGTGTAGTGNTGTGTAGTSSGTAGSGTSPEAQECADAPVVCLDKDTASTCNPDTLMDESITCSTGVANLGPGLISNGCITDAEGSGCSFDFEDQACEDGAPAYAACSRAAGFPIEDLEAYFACFTNEQGSKDFIPCFAGFVDAAAQTVACSDAEEACFADVSAGGAGGAGG
jgi:hypothetical protein